MIEKWKQEFRNSPDDCVLTEIFIRLESRILVQAANDKIIRESGWMLLRTTNYSDTSIHRLFFSFHSLPPIEFSPYCLPPQIQDYYRTVHSYIRTVHAHTHVNKLHAKRISTTVISQRGRKSATTADVDANGTNLTLRIIDLYWDNHEVSYGTLIIDKSYNKRGGFFTFLYRTLSWLSVELHLYFFVVCFIDRWNSQPHFQ